MEATTTTMSTDGAAASRSSALSPPPKETSSEQLAFIEEMTADAHGVQERVLAEILSRNGDSEYLVKHCGSLAAGATDRAAFRAKVPMVTYEDLKPCILRIANGDESPILTGPGHPVSEFWRSSGTSGGYNKLIPVVEDDFARHELLLSLAMAVRYVCELDNKGSALSFFFVRWETTTPGGLPVRTVLTSLFKRMLSSDKGIASSCDPSTSPPAAILCEDAFQSMYAQMLCGLCLRHGVARVGAVFAFGLLRAVQFLQQHWEQLAGDIDAGELGACVSDEAVRDAVAGVLRPDHELAEFIRAECGKGDWAGIITRVWPNTKYLDTIATGSMAQYVPTLNYFSGDLPIVSTRYAASECPIGINLDLMCDPSAVSYTILPNMAYFEFLPVDAAADDATASELVELAGVETGREYELVVTTYAGLNRYRVGDVLRVTGFHNAAPQFRFVGRKNVLLSIAFDKTEEAELQVAVDRAAALLRPHGAAVLDYTSRTSTAGTPGHYVVYWELRGANGGVDVDGGVLDMCCLEMEEALSFVYRALRVKDGAIGPLEIRVVRPGTFEELADHAVAHGGAAIGQYKVPRSVTAPAIIQLLDSRVVSSHFSPGLPHWTQDASALNWRSHVERGSE